MTSYLLDQVILFPLLDQVVLAILIHQLVQMDLQVLFLQMDLMDQVDQFLQKVLGVQKTHWVHLDQGNQLGLVILCLQSVQLVQRYLKF